MKKLIGLFFSIISISCSCEKEKFIDETVSETKTLTELKPIWTIPLSDDGTSVIDWAKGEVHNVDDMYIFDNSIILPKYVDGAFTFALCALEDGKEKWIMDNTFSQEDFRLANKIFNEKDEIVMINQRNISTLNLTTGKLRFNELSDNLIVNYSFSVGNSLAFGTLKDRDDNYINSKFTPTKGCYYDIKSEDIITFLYPPNVDSILKIQDDIDYAGIDKVAVNFEDGKMYIYAIYGYNTISEPYPQSRHSFLGKYDFQEKRWIYEGVQLDKYSGDFLFVRDFFIVRNGHKLYSFNLIDGSKNWETSFGSGLSASRMGIADDILVVQWDDVHGVDINTGRIIWTQPSSVAGGGSWISHRYTLNGVVYYTSPRGLIALNPKTGHLYWKVDINGERDGDSFTQDWIAVVPDEDGVGGKVIVHSWYKAYCFNAIEFE